MPPELAELCRRAEATGADSLWAVDHLFWPHPIGEPMTTLAVAAAATTRPDLGTCVLQLPLRQPAAVAKQATALQLLSGGRFVLGVGRRASTRASTSGPASTTTAAGRLMDEGVARLREAWVAADAGPTTCQEPSLRARSRSGSAGSSDAARRRAAAMGDGWIPLFLTPDDYATALAALRRETEPRPGATPTPSTPGCGGVRLRG